MTGESWLRRALLEPVGSSVGDGRRLVRDLLQEADREDLLDSAELVVSELVTNALLHAGTRVDLEATVDAEGLVLRVGDGSSSLPAARDYAALAGTGRGLALVDQLSNDWSVEPTAGGKVVWARVTGTIDVPRTEHGDVHGGRLELVGIASDVDAADDAPTDGSGVADIVDVVLRNVPLLMHAAWHQHAEALLREYLLTRMDDDDLAALAEHAVVSEALAVLREQLPEPLLPAELDDGWLDAMVEPGASLPEGVVQVPTGAVASFTVLNTVLDAALALAEDDRLLTAPIQPELRALRRWLCAQVTSQSQGGLPVAWAPPAASAALPPPGPAIDTDAWEPGPVDRSSHALIAADDANRIVAVSRPALELLGYHDPEQLTGRRLVVLIPPRFRQAHLAGFTLHFTSGRRALIGQPVRVPFLDATGHERVLDLTVEVVQVGAGRKVFIATLAPPSD